MSLSLPYYDWVLHRARRYKCGKCGSFPSYFHEHIEGTDVYEVEVHADGRVVLRACGMSVERGGALYARCDCGHYWRLRGVRNIDDISDKIDEASNG